MNLPRNASYSGNYVRLEILCKGSFFMQSVYCLSILYHTLMLLSRSNVLKIMMKNGSWHHSNERKYAAFSYNNSLGILTL